MQIYISEFNKDRFSLKIGYNPEVISRLKQIAGFSWHPEDKFWSFPGTQENLNQALEIAYQYGIPEEEKKKMIIIVHVLYTMMSGFLMKN